MISILRKILKPDVVLIQSSNTGRIFSNLGFKTRILPSGVNTEKFKPVTLVRKRELREKYSIAVDKYVIMHVGPILRQRNIQILEKLQRDPENQVVIIGSTAINADKKLILELVNCGCKVWVKYMENLEEIYQLSDVYVFPTTDQSHSAIDQPLSVIEAMSCNIPVISTPFGGLPDIFKEDGGIYFFTLEADLLSKINALKSGTSKIYTKDKAYHRSWDNIAGELEEIYRTL